jgi:hypothetical protein
MTGFMKGFTPLIAVTLIAWLSPAAPAFAAPPTAEVARMCRDLAIKAYPTKPPGSRSGVEQAQRTYFQDCVAKNSKKQD